MATIRLPHKWVPRDYQMAGWTALERGIKRGIWVWPRRHGKDDAALHWTATAAFRQVGTYWHMLPEASQARKAIWEAVNPKTGKRRIDEAFPPSIRATTKSQDMFIRFVNGSTWQVVGSDNYNSLVGAPPIGVVFSEFAIANPTSWAFIRPILRENGGWALFVSTPRGRNHLANMFEAYESDPEWFVQKLTAKETGVFTARQLDAERKDYIREYGRTMGLSLFRQEYLCSFDAAIPGAYYGPDIEEAESEGRICAVPVEKQTPVHTAWDLGRNDQTVIWFFQVVGREIHLVDYYANSGVGLDHYAGIVKERGYHYGDHYFPHDVEVQELGAPAPRKETLRNFGIKVRTLKRESVEDRIQAVRNILSRCWFDKDRTYDGYNALRQYRRIWDDKRKVFQDRPYHDWASDPADAFGYMAQALRTAERPVSKALPKIRTDWVV